jgi:hypothetical protein
LNICYFAVQHKELHEKEGTMIYRLSGIIFGVLFFVVMAGCGGGGGGGGATTSASTTSASTTSVSLVSIEVSPVNPSIALGTARQFAATGIFSDNSTQDLTAQVTWSSSDGAVASISNTGLAAGLATGSTTIAAASGGISGTTTLTVTNATLVSIGVTPANPSIPTGVTRQFAATGIFSDNSTQDLSTQVTWSSSDGAFASINNAGLATGLAAGSTTIKAELDISGIIFSGTTTLTVTSAQLTSITITPADQTIAKGTTLQFTATGTYDDNSLQDVTTQVVWSSSNAAVASISNAGGSNGLATAVDGGSTFIEATLGGVKGNTTLSVHTAKLLSITVTLTNPAIQRGETVQCTATGFFQNGRFQDLTQVVLWSSSKENVAALSNETGHKGLATGVGSGDTMIRATWSDVSGMIGLSVL